MVATTSSRFATQTPAATIDSHNASEVGVKIGVISDTHGLFDESIVSIFAGVDLIIHAGDIGKLEVIARLEEIAPVIAVEGNNDSFGRFPA